MASTTATAARQNHISSSHNPTLKSSGAGGMGTSQKYSLRWNDFSVNVASTFRDLHSRQDFVDVTLACADGTIDAHKVILSSVSTYFRDILKTAPCKHPIIILKDTCREEARAMLEFAYTGEVNVGQDVLPSLLHTARCFRIKGLDNVQTPPGLIEHNASQAADHDSWAGSLPPTRPHTPPTRPHTPLDRVQTPSTRPHSPVSRQPSRGPSPHTRPHSPSSVQSTQDIKPMLVGPDHFLVLGPGAPPPSPRAPGSQPPTRPCTPHTNSLPSREPSPHPGQLAQLAQLATNARTPPPKRWKRSFDLARSEVPEDLQEQVNSGTHQPLNRLHEVNGQAAMDMNEAAAKRFCDDKRYSNISMDGMEVAKRFADPDTGAKRFAEPPRILNYPHSMPASPTMLDARNLNSLGLLRHFARVGADSQPPGFNGLEPQEAHNASRVEARAMGNDPIDYHQYNTETNPEGTRLLREDEDEHMRRERLAFRPESAPTVLDMSPDGSNMSVRSYEHEHDERINHFRNIVVGTSVNGQGDLSDCVSKGMPSSNANGRYSCDECGKLFKHPGSLQHHRHIHRGTHRCPTCGKAFSRRWDMERHLNKSKYGCPANRFSASGSPVADESQQMSLGVRPHEGQSLITLAPTIAHNPINGTAT